MRMKHIKRLLRWLDEHILELLAGFLLVFIPLYPKWPLTDVLPGYIVRLRLEDLLVAVAIGLYLIQLARKRVGVRDNPLGIPILLYLVIGLVSSLSALFVTKTVPLERIHVAKLFLHWLRRVEYMSLAFIFFSSVNTSRKLRRIIAILAIVVGLLTLYGFGQKYVAWPVYSTMNREFAKGWRLVLTEHARVPSTFAGHYDFAAYSVMMLAVLGSLMLYTKGAKLSKGLIIAFIASFVSLLLTASRTSFIAYLIAMSAVIVLLALRTGWRWAAQRWLAIILLSLFGMLVFGDLSSRFAHILRIDEVRNSFADKINQRLGVALKPRVEVGEDLALVYTQTDQPPLPLIPPDEALPPDVYERIPLAFPEATLSAGTDSAAASLAGKPRTYSPAAFTYGLSSAIRFDALWPRALQAFTRNPFLGTGYSTLVKTELTEFTEAESTDNDFLRALGETGLLGFVSFFGILGFALFRIVRDRDRLLDPLLFALVVGIGGAIVGMLVNGLYIDVFEASKVAYTFWALMGILFASLKLATKNQPK